MNLKRRVMILQQIQKQKRRKNRNFAPKLHHLKTNNNQTE